MYGLFIRWPDGRFVLMERGSREKMNWLMNWLIDERDNDPDDIRVAPI